MGEKARRARKKGRDRETGDPARCAGRDRDLGRLADRPADRGGAHARRGEGRGAALAVGRRDAGRGGADESQRCARLLDKSGSGRPVVVSRPDEVSTVHVNGLDGTPPDVRTAVRKALVVLDNLPDEARAEVERIGAIKARVARDGTGGDAAGDGAVRAALRTDGTRARRGGLRPRPSIAGTGTAPCSGCPCAGCAARGHGRPRPAIRAQREGRAPALFAPGEVQVVEAAGAALGIGPERALRLASGDPGWRLAEAIDAEIRLRETLAQRVRELTSSPTRRAATGEDRGAYRAGAGAGLAVPGRGAGRCEGAGRGAPRSQA